MLLHPCLQPKEGVLEEWIKGLREVGYKVLIFLKLTMLSLILRLPLLRMVKLNH